MTWQEFTEKMYELYEEAGYDSCDCPVVFVMQDSNTDGAAFLEPVPEHVEYIDDHDGPRFQIMLQAGS